MILFAKVFFDAFVLFYNKLKLYQQTDNISLINKCMNNH